jgi:Zn-finger nucleic acid-binding protein
VLGDRVAAKILRLLKLSRQQIERACPFCHKPMSLVTTQEPPLALDACRMCNTVWFDRPTYESLPELTLETTNSMPMQATEIIALERLKDLKAREEEERKQPRKRKLLHRDLEKGEDSRRAQ